MTRTPTRFAFAGLAAALAAVAVTAHAAEGWSPSAYLPSPLQGRGALAGELLPTPSGAETIDDWMMSPGRFIASPLYGRGLATAASETAAR